MVKDNQTKWIAIIGIALILFYYGGQNGWFSSVNTYSTQNQYTDNLDKIIEYSSYSVSLSFNPSTLCVGDVSTGSIDSNIPNGVCSLFINSDGTWKFLQNYNLNSNGDVSDSNEINQVGTAKLKAICCDSKGNCKVSNEATLVVNSCNNPSACTDSDGGIKEFLAGKVTTSLGNFYDTCQPGNSQLLEFYCDSFNMQSSTTINCANGCTQSISGGYCNTEQAGPTCIDSDGGQDDQYNIFGTCASSVTKTTSADSCTGYNLLREYYCANDFTCKFLL